MDRRETLKAIVGGAAGVAAGLGSAREALAQATATTTQPAAAARDRARSGGLPALKITDIKVIITKLGGTNRPRSIPASRGCMASAAEHMLSVRPSWRIRSSNI